MSRILSTLRGVLVPLETEDFQDVMLSEIFRALFQVCSLRVVIQYGFGMISYMITLCCT